MEIHHIVGAAGRKHDSFNLILLCARCHARVHTRVMDNPDIPRGAILTAKEEEDGSVDCDKLAALKHRRALPYEPEPIPDWYKEQRHRKGGDPWP